MCTRENNNVYYESKQFKSIKNNNEIFMSIIVIVYNT